MRTMLNLTIPYHAAELQHEHLRWRHIGTQNVTMKSKFNASNTKTCEDILVHFCLLY